MSTRPLLAAARDASPSRQPAFRRPTSRQALEALPKGRRKTNGREREISCFPPVARNHQRCRPSPALVLDPLAGSRCTRAVILPVTIYLLVTPRKRLSPAAGPPPALRRGPARPEPRALGPRRAIETATRTEGCLDRCVGAKASRRISEAQPVPLFCSASRPLTRGLEVFATGRTSTARLLRPRPKREAERSTSWRTATGSPVPAPAGRGSPPRPRFSLSASSTSALKTRAEKETGGNGTRSLALPPPQEIIWKQSLGSEASAKIRTHAIEIPDEMPGHAPLEVR